MDLRSLTKPWLGPLLRQQALCRAIILCMGTLAVAAMMGVSLWPCTFADVTGLPCPGCGLTRGGLALMRGDWRAALLFHPFTPFFFILGALVGIGAILPKTKLEVLAGRVERFEQKTKLTMLFLAAVLSFSLLRMLGLWYQPPVSGPARALFQRRPAVSQTSEPEIKSHSTP